MRQRASKLGTVAVAGVATVGMLAGCKNGSASEAGPGGEEKSSAPPSASSHPSAKTSLTVEVRKSPNAKAETWKLTCDPAGGTHPRAQAACTALAKGRTTAKGGDPFAPVPKTAMCTQIYGGPQVATVKGTWDGRAVDATFNRKNGCNIARWNRLAPMFG